MTKENKFYALRDNCIIVYPETEKEEDITEFNKECNYCIYDPEFCGHTSPYCDWQKFSGEWGEVD